MSILNAVFGSWRTTLAGVLGIVLATVGQTLVPQLAAYLGSQPNIGWQILGMTLGAVGPALMKDAAKPAA